MRAQAVAAKPGTLTGKPGADETGGIREAHFRGNRLRCSALLQSFDSRGGRPMSDETVLPLVSITNPILPRDLFQRDYSKDSTTEIPSNQPLFA